MRDWGDTAVITRYGLGVRVMSCRRIWQPSAGRWYVDIVLCVKKITLR